MPSNYYACPKCGRPVHPPNWFGLCWCDWCTLVTREPVVVSDGQKVTWSTASSIARKTIESSDSER